MHFVNAQVYNDAGLWLTLKAEKKITPRFSAELTQEFRMDENISELGEFYTESGIVYKFNKSIRFSADFRYENKYKNHSAKDEIYNKRYYYFINIYYKFKLKPFVVELRTREEEEYKTAAHRNDNFGSSLYSKNKLTLKLNLGKQNIPITPYAYIETFTPLNNSPYGFIVDKTKLCAGADYRINRVHEIGLYYLIQRNYYSKNPETDYVIGLEYNFTF